MKSILVPIGMVISVTIMSLTLTSGISVNHIPRVEKIIQEQNYSYQYTEEGLTIYLKPTIKGPEVYTDLIMLLDKHRNVKNIRISLAGNGGSVASTFELYYMIKSLPANVTMVVRGDVYSAHAFLALAGNKIEVLNPNILFMFHVPAVNMGGEYVKLEKMCEEETGNDRGVSKKAKCEEYVKYHIQAMKDTLEKLLIAKILTPEQVKQYYEGHDIIISGAQVMSRIGEK